MIKLLLIIAAILITSSFKTAVPFESQISFTVEGTYEIINESLTPLNTGRGEFRKLKIKSNESSFEIKISYFDSELILINDYVQALNKNASISNLEVKLYLSSEITNHLLKIEEIEILRTFSKRYYVYFDKQIWTPDK